MWLAKTFQADGGSHEGKVWERCMNRSSHALSRMNVLINAPVNDFGQQGNTYLEAFAYWRRFDPHSICARVFAGWQTLASPGPHSNSAKAQAP